MTGALWKGTLCGRRRFVERGAQRNTTTHERRTSHRSCFARAPRVVPSHWPARTRRSATGAKCPDRDGTAANPDADAPPGNRSRGGLLRRARHEPPPRARVGVPCGGHARPRRRCKPLGTARRLGPSSRSSCRILFIGGVHELSGSPFTLTTGHRGTHTGRGAARVVPRAIH